MDDHVGHTIELTQLANTIKTKLKSRHIHLAQWRLDTQATAIALARARDLHPSDIAFGHWCTAQFGENLRKNERAILVRWGRDPDATAALLESTTSFSIQMIDQRARFPMPTDDNTQDDADDDTETNTPKPIEETPIDKTIEDTTGETDRAAQQAQEQADAAAKAKAKADAELFARIEAKLKAAERARAQAKARADERANARAEDVHQGFARPYATMFLTKQDFTTLVYALSEEQTSPERRLEAFKLVNAFRDRNRRKK